MPDPNEPTDPRNAPKAPIVRSKDMDSELPPDADAEERFNEFWKKNGSSVFAAIAVGAVIVIGTQTWRHLQAKAELETRQEFGQAQSTEVLETFAQEHDDHSLAGLAYLKLANEAFERGEFSGGGRRLPAGHFAPRGTPLLGRATLGAAVSTLRAGDAAAGATALREILNNESFQPATRTEAGYLLTVHFMGTEGLDGDARGGRCRADVRRRTAVPRDDRGRQPERSRAALTSS
jgi:predicted negative regulator of RcsB-dependent stress response